MNRKQRTLKNAIESIKSSTSIVERFIPERVDLTKDDAHGLRVAANQARIATMELDILIGMLEAEQE